MIYIIILFMLLVVNQIKYKKTLEKIVIIIFSIFLCFTFLNGSDWHTYKEIYSITEINNLDKLNFEKGYLLYSLLFKAMGFNFWIFFIITKLLCLSIFFKVIDKYAVKKFFTIAIFYVQMGLYLFIDCPLRNLIAISLFLLALLNIEKRKYYTGIISIMIAYTVHKTILIVIPVLLIYKYYFKYIKNKKTFLWIIFFISFVFTSPNFIYKIIEFLKILPTLYDRIHVYFFYTKYNSSEIINIRVLEKYIVTFISLLCYKEIAQKYKYGIQILYFNVIFLLFYRIGVSLTFLIRFSLYFRIFNVILIVYLINSIKQNLFKNFFKYLYIAYLTLNIIVLVNSLTIYKPYTNILFYSLYKKNKHIINKYREIMNYEKDKFHNR